MTRRKIIAGNWKMHGSRRDAEALLMALKQGVSKQEAPKKEMVVFPPFVHIPLAQKILENSPIAWGAQNSYIGASGAFTGEISAPMLADYGCRYVLVGHSERRTIFKEDLECVVSKFQSVLTHGLQPILCVGETLVEREKNSTNDIVKKQVMSVIEKSGIAAFKEVVIAYEPVWAIGTGLTATPEQAQEVHAFIRDCLKEHDKEIAAKTPILYGGSVKADNAKGLFAMPDIDGGLVGGASLVAKDFLVIYDAI